MPDIMGDIGVGSMEVGGAGGVGVDGLVLARVTSGLPRTREVACPRASYAASRGNGRASSSRDSNVLVDAMKGLLLARWAWASAWARADVPGRPWLSLIFIGVAALAPPCSLL